jgi:hypothetical protein
LEVTSGVTVCRPHCAPARRAALVTLTEMLLRLLVALLRIDEMPVFVRGERCHRQLLREHPARDGHAAAIRSTGVEGQAGGAT